MSAAPETCATGHLHGPFEARPRSATVLADGHAHFHAEYDLGRFLDAARANFAAALRMSSAGTMRQRAGLNDGEPAAAGCLLMTESAGADWFRRWADAARRDPDSAFAETTEECALAVKDDTDVQRTGDGRGVVRLFIIAGRQINCTEGLEVLALLTTARFPDGRPIRDTLEAVVGAGAVAVLPWGFGKWTGRRAQVMRSIIEQPPGDRAFLGDNGGRPAVARRPALFAHAEARGWKVLAGSDPLPWASQMKRVGSYGSAIAGEFDPARPAASIRTMLCGLQSTPCTFGRLTGAAAFLRSQVAMQWRKRTRRTESLKFGK